MLSLCLSLCLSVYLNQRRHTHATGPEHIHLILMHAATSSRTSDWNLIHILDDGTFLSPLSFVAIGKTPFSGSSGAVDNAGVLKRIASMLSSTDALDFSAYPEFTDPAFAHAEALIRGLLAPKPAE